MRRRRAARSASCRRQLRTAGARPLARRPRPTHKEHPRTTVRFSFRRFIRHRGWWRRRSDGIEREIRWLLGRGLPVDALNVAPRRDRCVLDWRDGWWDPGADKPSADPAASYAAETIRPMARAGFIPYLRRFQWIIWMSTLCVCVSVRDAHRRRPRGQRDSPR